KNNSSRSAGAEVVDQVKSRAQIQFAFLSARRNGGDMYALKLFHLERAGSVVPTLSHAPKAKYLRIIPANCSSIIAVPFWSRHDSTHPSESFVMVLRSGDL